LILAVIRDPVSYTLHLMDGLVDDTRPTATCFLLELQLGTRRVTLRHHLE